MCTIPGGRGVFANLTVRPLSQNDDQVVAMFGIAESVVGSAVFLRYSLAQFQRFWLARLIYEQQAATDRMLAGGAHAGAASAGPVSPRGGPASGAPSP